VVIAEMGHQHSEATDNCTGNYKYAVVLVEYFTKWIEAKPLVNIAAAGLRRIFWRT
jgi:hypothetical protein